MSDLDLDDLREELAEFAPPERTGGRSAREERIIAGFEDIQRFVDEHGRAPQHGEDRDIFERLYAVRLDRIRSSAECLGILQPLDRQGLLTTDPASDAVTDGDDDALLDELRAELGGDAVSELRHVRPSAEKQAAEEIAARTACKDFDRFAPLFDAVQHDLATGVRTARAIRKDAGFLKTDIREGQFFFLGGQTVFVAAVGEPFKAPNGESDARLRAIYSNATESDILQRSLQRALYKDQTSRLISDPAPAGPLFADQEEPDDLATGTVYVLRSLSEHPAVKPHRALLHKIGVTGGDVERRIAAARLDPTFLMADVEIVATYQLFNIKRSKLENLIHRVFAPARLDVTISDRFGNPVIPREWFLVPLFVIDEAIEKIRDGSITGLTYDPSSARFSCRTLNGPTPR